VSAHFSTEIVAFYQFFADSYPIPMKICVGLFDATSWFWDIGQHKKFQEIEGIVKGVNNPSFTMPVAVMLNSFYEFEAWCTSIVVKQPDGTIIHSRNLDGFGPSKPIAITLAYNAMFTKGGKYLGEAVIFGGTIGSYTGMKAGAFSISSNNRFLGESPLKLVQNILMIATGFDEPSWLIRETIERCDDYDCAYNYLRNVPTTSYAYLILAGVKDNEGVIFARSNW